MKILIRRWGLCSLPDFIKIDFQHFHHDHGYLGSLAMLTLYPILNLERWEGKNWQEGRWSTAMHALPHLNMQVQKQ